MNWIIFSHNIGQYIIEYLNSSEKITANEIVDQVPVLNTFQDAT